MKKSIPLFGFCAVLLIGDVSSAAEAKLETVSAKTKPIAARPSGGTGGETGVFPNQTIVVGDLTREYRLIVPESLDSQAPTPLIFAFHGFLFDSKDRMARYSGLAKFAQKQGFIIVFPAGLQARWILELKDNIDVAFFDVLYEHITERYNIDLNRVYLTGMSNGGYFSNLLASKRSEKIAAIAPHSAGLGFLAIGGIQSSRKYPVMIVHGTADRIVGIAQARQSRETYEREGHEVEYLEVKGLSHRWGNRVDVNSKMWEFFQSHPLDAAESN